MNELILFLVYLNLFARVMKGVSIKVAFLTGLGSVLKRVNRA